MKYKLWDFDILLLPCGYQLRLNFAQLYRQQTADIRQQTRSKGEIKKEAVHAARKKEKQQRCTEDATQQRSVDRHMREKRESEREREREREREKEKERRRGGKRDTKRKTQPYPGGDF